MLLSSIPICRRAGRSEPHSASLKPAHDPNHRRGPTAAASIPVTQAPPIATSGAMRIAEFRRYINVKMTPDYFD